MSERRFEQILELLPAIYRDQEELHVLVRLIAETVEVLKVDIDRLPALVDYRKTPEALLAFLAREWGLPFLFPQSSSEHLRWRRIGEALAILRRKTTRDALTRDLVEHGWAGTITEGKDEALRLNVRGRLNHIRLDGALYNHGTVLFRSALYCDWHRLRPVLEFHHPVGTTFLFFGRYVIGWRGTMPRRQAGPIRWRTSATSTFFQVFILNHSRLAGRDRLTMDLFCHEGMTARFPHGFVLNHTPLNESSRLNMPSGIALYLPAERNYR